MLAIICGFVFWFGCSLLSFFFQLLSFFNIFFIFYFNNFIFLSFFLSSPPPFLLSCVADRILVLWPGVRPEPLRWESRVKDSGPSETSRPHLISNDESSPRDLRLNAKTSSTQRSARCSARHPMPNNKQVRNTTTPISREAT